MSNHNRISSCVDMRLCKSSVTKQVTTTQLVTLKRCHTRQTWVTVHAPHQQVEEQVRTPAPELRGLASLADTLSSSDAALTRVKLDCREGGSHTSGSSGLAVCDSTLDLSAPPKLAALWKLLLSDVRILAAALSDSRSPGEGSGLLYQNSV